MLAIRAIQRDEPETVVTLDSGVQVQAGRLVEMMGLEQIVLDSQP